MVSPPEHADNQIVPVENVPILDYAPQPSAGHRPLATGHIPALDGVRGLAIVLVMVTHLTVLSGACALDRGVLAVAHYGWVGVDLFFVLSGFLITGILFDSKGTSAFFRNFYARRTVRIFPLYYAVVFVTLVLLPHSPSNYLRKFGELHGPQVWYWLYLSNFHMAWVGQYTNHILAPTWSLAIEEQFYLVWPTVIFFCTRKTLLRVCAGLVIAAMLVRSGLLMGHPNDLIIYLLTFTRMDSLAIGAFIALSIRGSATMAGLGRASWVTLCAGTALLAITVALAYASNRRLDEITLYTSLGLLSAAILLAGLSAPVASPVGRILNSDALRFFGRYSYGIYLFHLPITIILRDRLFGPTRFPRLGGSELPGQFLFYILATGLSVGAALLSWNLYEKHFLKLKRYFPSGSRAASGKA